MPILSFLPEGFEQRRGLFIPLPTNPTAAVTLLQEPDSALPQVLEILGSVLKLKWHPCSSEPNHKLSNFRKKYVLQSSTVIVLCCK